MTSRQLGRLAAHVMLLASLAGCLPSGGPDEGLSSVAETPPTDSDGVPSRPDL